MNLQKICFLVSLCLLLSCSEQFGQEVKSNADSNSSKSVVEFALNKIPVKKWQEQGNCGVNAVFTVLKMAGIEATYEEVHERLSPGDRGSNLLDMRDVLNEYGLKYKVAWDPLAEEKVADQPIIVHSQYRSNAGHFAVVFRQGDSLYAVDGANFDFNEFENTKVAKPFGSGYVLVPDNRSVVSGIGRWIAILICSIVIFIAAATFARGSNPFRFKLILCVVVVGLLGTSYVVYFGNSEEHPEKLNYQNVDYSKIHTPLRENPIELSPLGQPMGVFEKNEMAEMLEKVSPYWRYRRASDMAHGLLLWGTEFEFPKQAPFPIEENSLLQPAAMYKALSETEEMKKITVNLESHLTKTEYGVGEKLLSSGGLAHMTQLASVFAESGISTNSGIVVEGEVFSVRDLVVEIMARSHEDKHDSEFGAVALSAYLPPESKWHNRFGEEWSFDRLVSDLLNKNQEHCSCLGSHISYSLAWIWRVHKTTPIVLPETEKKISDYFKAKVSTLRNSQHATGFWFPPTKSQSTKKNRMEEWSTRLLYTGHTLEWISILPVEARPEKDQIILAMRWSWQQIIAEPNWLNINAYNLCAKTHAARAIVNLEQFDMLEFERFINNK